MIYYVEDDENIRELVVYTLNATGLAAKGLPDGEAFFAACRAELPSLILLDVMLPGEDGVSILQRIRQNPSLQNTPVMMITARGAEYDKVQSLDLGADDYVTKPFGMMELISRVRALLRRTNVKKSADVLTAGALTLDLKRHAAFSAGEEIPLTFKEFELLRLLMQNPGMAFTREQLLAAVWDYAYDGGTRTVDVHVQSLRQKLRACGSLIQTVRGVGYRLEAQP